MIKIEASGTDEFVTCTDASCVHWFAYVTGKIEAYKAGERHARSLHGVDARTASQARRQYLARQRRHAANS